MLSNPRPFGSPAATTLLLAALALLVALPMSGQAASAVSPNEHYFTNVELVNQRGEPMRLYEDLMQGKTVVINAFFTECTGVCPVMAKKMAQLQEHFADRMGSDLRLISMSVDPITDSPEQLAKFAERYGAGPSWYFVGGNKQNVDFALGRLGQKVDEREAHSNLLLIGNLRTGLWKKVLGIAEPEKLVAYVNEVLDDTGADGAPSPDQPSVPGD